MLQREQAIKSSLVLAVGVLSWAGVAICHTYFWPKQFRLSKLLLGIFAASLLLTGLLSADHTGAFFGTPYDRIGTAFLLSLIGIGLVIRMLDAKIIVSSLYITTLLLAIVSIPYNILFFGYLVRLAGPLRQPDILAVWLGCGFLFGLSVYAWYPRFAKPVLAGQALLISTILLTGTRAIIFLVPLIALLYLWRVKRYQKLRIGLAVAAGCVIILLLPIIHSRISRMNDAQILGQDTLLRVHVQTVALQSVRTMPLLGYGPGHIRDVLACSKFSTLDLMRFCRLHVEFTSSHNIFLDRVLEFGWIGGVAFIMLTGYALYRGFRAGPPAGHAASSGLSLIALYYVTNVTTPEVELLYWVLLVYVIFIDPKGRSIEV